MEALNGKTKIYQHRCECGRQFASPGLYAHLCPVCARELHLARQYQDPGWVLEAWSQIQAKDMGPMTPNDMGGSGKKPGRPPSDGLWDVVVDPDDSWGYHTRLQLFEIKRLADLGYLADGTVFERRGKVLVYRDGTLARQLKEEYERGYGPEDGLKRDRANGGTTPVVE